MSIPWVAYSDGSNPGDSDCGGGYKPSPREYIYKEILESLIEENLVEIEVIQDIIQYNYENYKRTSTSCYKSTYEKGYEEIINKINEL